MRNFNIPLARTLQILSILVLWLFLPSGVDAQQENPNRPEFGDRGLRGILGGVEFTVADSARQRLVDRLDFENYKELIRGLTQFGDREQGTARNAAAVDWIEDQLRSWGYETERIHYQYTPRGSDQPEPREEVFATKVGDGMPGEMYILGAHMDGRGGGEAANDDASGTALVMEIARVLAAPDVGSNRSIRFALWNNEETGVCVCGAASFTPRS